MSAPGNVIEKIQPDVFYRITSEAYFNPVSVFRLREKRLDTEVNQALGGLFASNKPSLLSRPGTKGGATIEVPMPSLSLDTGKASAPGPLVIVEQRFITREFPTINLGANGTGITSESLAVQLIQTFHQAGSEYLGLSWYPASVPYEPQPVDPTRPCLSHVAKMLAKLELSPLTRLADPSISGSTAAVTLTDNSGLGGTVLYYTLDGSFPGPGNPAVLLYAAPFAVASGTMVRFAAWNTINPALVIGSDDDCATVT